MFVVIDGAVISCERSQCSAERVTMRSKAQRAGGPFSDLILLWFVVPVAKLLNEQRHHRQRLVLSTSIEGCAWFLSIRDRDQQDP